MKKIVFLAHEFGLFPGHGGIASYLDILVNQLLERNDDIEVYVFAYVYDKKNAALKNRRFKINAITGRNLHEQGINICKYLKKIKPDYVECADYLALGLESIVYKYESDHNELSDTVFITLHHTASRECFEWNEKLPVKYANSFIQECYGRERVQMQLSDLNVSPSMFLAEYVSKNYKLTNVITIHTPCMVNICSKKDILRDLDHSFDLAMYKNRFIINCISRIEGRKNQYLLVKQFIKFLEKTKADALLIIVGNSSVNTSTNTDYRVEIFDSIPDQYKHNIIFYDFMNSKEKARILAISDLTVLASTYENFPIAMIESICNEVPVMCSKYCGFSDCMDKSYDTMAFDPFEEDTLSQKLEAFYKMSEQERYSITKDQINTISTVSSYKNTINYRIQIYEETRLKKSPKEQINPIVIDDRNFLEVIDDNFLSEKYDSIIVDYYWDKTNINTLVKWFGKMSHNFSDGDIICYSGDFPLLRYNDILVNWRPFYIKGVKFNETHKGQRLVDAIIENTHYDQEVFTLLDELGGLTDSIKGEINQSQNSKRAMMMNMLQAGAFVKMNKLDLRRKMIDEIQ